VVCATGVPHSLQNLEFGGSSMPHDPQDTPAAVSAPRPSAVLSTSVSCHRWSAMSVVSPCLLRYEVLSFVVPSGRPRMRENRVRSLAEVGGS